MPCELYISPSALKKLKTLDPKIKELIKEKLKLLATDQFTNDSNIKQLKGKHHTKYFRIKTGDYRVIYHIENNGIYIDKIGHRKNIYRGF